MAFQLGPRMGGHSKSQREVVSPEKSCRMTKNKNGIENATMCFPCHKTRPPLHPAPSAAERWAVVGAGSRGTYLLVFSVKLVTTFR
ncbi:hypothetical protein SAMN05444164_1117 [Bradyrhizobium erythrophlei]|uniref:Uncharacterized protein n=1 Tax=Bradyrhizobium erythrophlei TaxID=1437360 RepID=A0A1H4Q261_9BRAD|nr:hypothetical protein SAMN05444164_1117 [Bradyrhizobium erythrophlei]